MDAKMVPKIDDKAEICHQMLTKSPKTVTEIRRMEPKAGKWKLEGAKRASEGGKSATGSWYPVPIRPVSGDLCAKSLDPRGDPSLKYIRSGPEGARGVLKGRGWSLCMFLSELLLRR